MPADAFNPNFTENVISATGPNASPRTREIIGPLVRHLHAFAREANLTVDEWMEGVRLVNWAGQMSDDRRNEGQLICDVLGLESYVDYILIIFPFQIDTVLMKESGLSTTSPFPGLPTPLTLPLRLQS